MSYKTIIVRNIEELPINRHDWDLLVEKNEINTIFQTYDWFICWWSTFGETDNLFLILIYEDTGKLSALAPLCKKPASKNERDLVFIGDGNADYVDFLIPDNKEEILRIILDVIKIHNNEINSFVLRNLPEYSSTHGLLMSLSCTPQYNISVIQKTTCPTLLVRNKEQEIRKLLGKYSLKRPYNYFKNQGDLRHIIFKDVELAENNLDTFFEQHIQRWQGTSSPSLFNIESNRSFYRSLLSSLLPQHRVLFSAIMLDDIPLSYHFGFDYNMVVTWYKPSYSVDYAKRSPGTLMVKYLIEYTLKNNRKELDFTIGDEPFKDRFTNIYRYNTTSIYFTNNTDYIRFERFRKSKQFLKLILKRK